MHVPRADHPEFAGSESSSSLTVATPLSQNNQSQLVEDVDYGLTVMASTMLNRDIDFSQPVGTITVADLDRLADLAQDATTTQQQAIVMDDYNLTNIFEGRQNRTITQESQRLQSLSQSAQHHLSLLQNLSSISDLSDVRRILLEAEQAVAVVNADLAKRRRKELQAEVDEAKSVVRRAEELLKTWRALHPDVSPVRLDNSEVAANPMSSHPTSTLIAFSMAFVARVMEGLGRRGSNFLLKTARLFGYSLTYLQQGGPNYQQQAALSSIPDDVRGLEQKFNLDVETTVFAVCPRCNCTYEPTLLPSSSDPSYPSRCTFRSTTVSDPCNEDLVSEGQPIKTFEFYSFLDWFGRFLALPGIGKYSEAFCQQVSSEGPPATCSCSPYA
ncbi:hypothetical protein F5878DRAFT_665383 [Lentinula raphanica]|uniref:Uncharacterized protein n=1 Tax=Lentinula raphanica TaxID=153919 RepID=A0AA38P064_9AGAR|nr:hypothetical protein F5878DRAFT_665383 [Lentinula raphanica]